MEYSIDLEKDYENICRHELSRIGYSIEDTDEAEDIEIKCLNYYLRLPTWHPRTVLEPKGFSSPLNLESYYNTLKQKITNGDDLTDYLSKLINRDYQDKLLEDWNIYHLHLFSQRQGEPHNPLDGNIVYCLITEQFVYVLLIGDHTQFSDQTMLSIISENWPELIKNSVVSDNGELMSHATNEEIAAHRKANINTILELNGQIVAPIGGGFDSCGNSTMVTITNDCNRRKLRDFEKNLNNYETKIRQRITDNGKSIPEKYDFSLIFEDRTFYIIENNTNIKLCTLPLNIKP